MPRRKAPRSYGEFRTLAGLLDFGVLWLDRNKALEFASPEAIALLGSPDLDELKHAWANLSLQFDLTGITQLEKGGNPLRGTVDLTRPHVSRLLRVEAYAVQHEDCECYLILLKDREVLDELSNQLLLASRVRGQAYLSSSVVHDLNAPINNMQLTLELLGSSVEGENRDLLPTPIRERLKRYVAVLKEEMGRLKGLVRTVPNYINPPQGVPVRFDLRAAIEDVSGLIKHEAIARQIQRQVLLPAAPIWITGDQEKIKLGLLNMAIVLLESSRRRGALVIEVRPGERVAEIMLQSDASTMTQDTLDQIYHLSFHSQRNGIGLFAARLVFESQGGFIEVLSEPGGKVRFNAALPSSDTAEVAR